MRAAQRLSAALVSRTGLGVDVHRFAEGEELWLGGLLIPHDKGLSGHSDAAVVLHALTDALLGAIGEGDIDDHFPPSDPQWRGAPSSRFAAHAPALIEHRGGHIAHVVQNIFSEEPSNDQHHDTLLHSAPDLSRHPLSKGNTKPKH